MEVEWNAQFKIFWLTYTLSSVSAADPGELLANKTKSSPSHVTSLKGSSLWLKWGYEYGGDIPRIIVYREQIIGFNSSSQAALQPVAKRTGANGMLQLVPTVPAPFSGRLTVIPSNDTLVISGLKYNDTAYQFASYIILDITLAGKSSSNRGDLKPVVSITIIVKLDNNPNLQAGKIIVDSCVELKWTKAESGACHVKYELRLKDASGIVVYTETGYNIDQIKKCKIPRNVNITDVEMTISFKSTSKVFTAKVSETSIPTTLPPTTSSKISETQVPSSSEPTTRTDTTHKSTVKGKTSVQPTACKEKQVNSDEEKDNIIIALSVVVAVSFIAMATMVTCLIRKKGKLTQAQDNGIKRNVQPKETHYMDLQGQTAKTDSTYAGLQSPYEEIHDAARNYENTKHLSSVL